MSVELVRDCARCAGLCCSLPFSRGREFPEDKPVQGPCRHLDDDHRCSIHDHLWEDGWRGCVAFDCFGAGQHVVQRTYAGARDPDPTERLAVFAIVRQLHETRFLLADPACTETSVAGEAVRLGAELAALGEGSPDSVLAVDLARWRARAGELFDRVASELGGPSYRGAELMATDLRGRDLHRANLLGADLRDADVRGADLSTALFLTQPQVTAARGDAATRLPSRLSPPDHWSSSPG
jgi:Pentapeptide repeats (8 copies)